MKFNEWWKSGVHGWGTEEQLSEYKLAKDAWKAAQSEILAILKKNELGRIQEYPGIVIHPRAIKEIEEL